ncbi:MAG: Rrf2 family transcriptional regulator [Acidobacteria bacterium]|nr:MAG: Rrf2 family transcriptional regulator [Acidobacteriota bacterium]
MKISKKGLYALEAMIRLARNYPEPAKIHSIAAAEDIPQKFLELILLDLKTARFVDSLRGAQGGYLLRRPPQNIFLGEIIRAIDGPLAPTHSALYQVFLDVRNAAAGILDHTSLAQIAGHSRSSSRP